MLTSFYSRTISSSPPTLQLQSHHMAPTRTSTERPQTPRRKTARREHDTIKKSRFFEAWDNRDEDESLLSICKRKEIPHPTALYWLRQRTILGDIAQRRTRPLSNNLGRKETVPKETYKFLVSNENSVRDQLYDYQIEYHELGVSARTLQRGLKRHTRGAQRFKRAFTRKTLREVNRKKRYKFGKQFEDETVDTFWQFLFFTDEAHIDPSSQGVGHILREEGTRYDTENIQQIPALEGVKLHIAGYVNWHYKCENLEFYNDEEEYVFKPQTRTKPRKSRYEEEEAFIQRLQQWEAEVPHERVVTPKGNAMTQAYYTDRLLPGYIAALHGARRHDDLSPWLLQEDNDGSHGHKKLGLAEASRRKNWIPILEHPAQSPDLNPMEGCWNILKQRVRRRRWNNLEELKQVIQEEWHKIDIFEIRARIAEMPERCRLLVKTGGKPIKSALW